MDSLLLTIDDPDRADTPQLVHEPVIDTCIELHTDHPLSKITNQASGAVESNYLPRRLHRTDFRNYE